MTFEEWWESENKANGGAAIGADYRHWAHCGWVAAMLNAPEADCGNMPESLRELAKEGAALHSPNQPERLICDGLLAALDENKRLREALKRAALALETNQDTIACWGAYASEYFRHKHDLHGDIESIRVAAVAARNALKA